MLSDFILRWRIKLSAIWMILIEDVSLPEDNKPVYRFTIDDKLVLHKDPTDPNPKALKFYRLRSDLGAFEVKEVIYSNSKIDATILVYSSNDDISFRMPRKWFDYLFESIDTIST